MNEVGELLERGFSFEQGLELLKEYNNNDGMISVIEKRKSMKHLAHELGKLARLPRLKPVHGYNVPVLPQPEGQAAFPVKQTETQQESVITYHNLANRFKNTKYDDMPNDFLKGIYKHNQDLYKELQYSHQQMKQANCDEGRAKFRADVLRLDEEIRKNWRVIDEEIERIESQPPQTSNDGINISTLRSFITRQLKKESLTGEELLELKRRVEIAQANGLKFSDNTVAKLKDLHVLG